MKKETMFLTEKNTLILKCNEGPIDNLIYK